MGPGLPIAGSFQLDMDRFVPPEEAADRLGVKLRQLADWRAKGRGPRYRKFHRLVRYSIADLKQFADARIVEPNGICEEACA